jgi:uncharacterized GH25 family protein
MRIGIALLVVAAATPAFAHDFFLAPSSHRVDPGDSVSVVMHVGSDQEMDELPRSNRRVIKFDAITGDDVRALEGKHGASPAGRVALDKPGVATIVFHSSHTDIELEGPKFEAYLEEEGLEDIIAQRKQLGVTASPGRESYARYAKALVSVGDAKTGWDRKVGLPAELVALTDPRAGGTAQFQLLFEDKPRAGARVDILRIEKARLVSMGHARTDADGKVSLAIPGDGVWLVATTLMRRTPEGLQVEGDWESFWVSITFETGKLSAAKKKSGGCASSDPSSLGIAFVLLALRRRR